MFEMCCLASAFCTGISGWSLHKAMKESKFAKALETGVDAPLKDGETTYAAIVCRSLPFSQPTLLPSDQKPVLLGRISIIDSTLNVGAGIGPAFGNNGLGVAMTTTTITSKHTLKFGFPEKARLSSNYGEVVANNPDLAIWDLSDKEVQECGPNQVEGLLRRLGWRANHSAGKYHLTTESFNPNIAVTIFGDVTKKGNFIEINPPQSEIPFVATAREPRQFVGQVHIKAAVFKRTATICALGAVVLGVGAFGMPKKWDINNLFK